MIQTNCSRLTVSSQPSSSLDPEAAALSKGIPTSPSFYHIIHTNFTKSSTRLIFKLPRHQILRACHGSPQKAQETYQECSNPTIEQSHDTERFGRREDRLTPTMCNLSSAQLICILHSYVFLFAVAFFLTDIHFARSFLFFSLFFLECFHPPCYFGVARQMGVAGLKR